MKIRLTIVVLLILPLFISCSLLGLKRHVLKLEEHGIVAVQVSPAPSGSAPTYALAWTPVAAGVTQSAGFQRVGSNGLAAFSLLLSNTYSVGAFTDENGNGKYDASEPMAFLGGIHPVPLADPKARAKVFTLKLIREHGLAPNTVIEIPKENPDLGEDVALALGDVTTLDDPRFARSTGSEGLWRPLDYLYENQMGIYFTEAYDPKRVPIIFVYGIGGSVQDWRYLIEHFDRSHYQLWLYQYPSGMRLGKVARALATGLCLLKERLRFNKCFVVAHSMGGLVSAEAIREAARQSKNNLIPHFVTISTPWGGHAAAELGVRHLSKPVPSWLDVRPESDFLHHLYDIPLPAHTRHDLIYGHLGEDDGTVTVASQLEPRITNQVASITGYEYGHEMILQKPEVLARIIQCLETER